MDYNKFNDKYKNILEMYENIKNQDITEKKDVIEEFFAADDGDVVVSVQVSDNEKAVGISAGLISTIVIVGLIFISPQVLLKYIPTAYATYITENGLIFDIFISIFSIIYLFTLFLNHAWKESIKWSIVIIIILLILFKYLKTSSSSDVFPIGWWFTVGIMLLFVNINNYLDIFESINKNNLIKLGGLIIPIVIIIFVLHIVGIKIPKLMTGIIVTILILVMTYIHNEHINVVKVEDSEHSYMYAGIFALLFGIFTSDSLISTDLLQENDEFLKELHNPASGFTMGIGSRIAILLLVLLSGYRYINVVEDNITSTEQFKIAKDTIIFVFPILIIMVLGTNIFNAGSSIKTLMYAFLTMLFLFGWFYLLSKLSDNQKEFINYATGLLFILFTIILSAILFMLTGNYMSSLSGVPGIISYILFYIPCLVIDLIEYIKNEISNTTPTIGILFILEIIIILAYLYLPDIVDKTIDANGMSIINKPTTLKSQIELSGGDRFKIPKDVNDLTGMNTEDKPRYNYAISMWVFMNANASNGNAINGLNVFSYNGKPNIKFKVNIDDPNGEDSHFIMELTNKNENDTNIKINLPLQKWHNFVFNYSRNAVDIFINGELYHSYTFRENNRPTYNIASDNLYIGDDNGLEGAICNLKYHGKPLTKVEIVTTYNLLNNYNPPIINL
jgi:hypothetical protein